MNYVIVSIRWHKRTLAPTRGETISGTFKLDNPRQDAIIVINLDNNYETEPLTITGSEQMLIKREPKLDTGVNISDGVLNINSTMNSDWGTVDHDPIGVWLNVPVKDSSRTYDAVWLTTIANATSLTSTEYYSWNAEITTHFGAKGRPDGVGGA